MTFWKKKVTGKLAILGRSSGGGGEVVECGWGFWPKFLRGYRDSLDNTLFHPLANEWTSHGRVWIE